MPRHDGGSAHQTKCKGKKRRGHGLSTYAKMNKSRNADRYDRPYLTGNYDRGLNAVPTSGTARIRRTLAGR